MYVFCPVAPYCVGMVETWQNFSLVFSCTGMFLQDKIQKLLGNCFMDERMQSYCLL